MRTKKTTDAQSMSRAKLACAMPCKKEEEQSSTPVTETSKKVYNLIIVDESGSMSIIHREALAGLNETITTCQQMHVRKLCLQERTSMRRTNMFCYVMIF